VNIVNLTFTGELLQTISHDKLPSLFIGVPSIRDGVPSIRDEVIAVPGWKDDMLCLFRIM